MYNDIIEQGAVIALVLLLVIIPFCLLRFITWVKVKYLEIAEIKYLWADLHRAVISFIQAIETLKKQTKEEIKYRWDRLNTIDKNFFQSMEKVKKQEEKELAANWQKLNEAKLNLITQKEELNQLFKIKQFNLENEREGLKQIAMQRQKGCPWLEDEYARLFALKDFIFETETSLKAPKASEKIKEANKARRKAEYNERIAKNILDYYEHEFPFLIEYKNEIIEVENTQDFKAYSDEERLDNATTFMSVSEYNKLSVTARNQLALDRYLNKNHSPAEIGQMYERFVGYEYEIDGWDVEFKGILDGFEDLGRDLICTKNNTALIIQCKNWAYFKTVHEKHIFQLFGTLYQYRKQIMSQKKYDNVFGYFYTTTKVSDIAHEFANELDIKIFENHKLNKHYPCIKCNINRATNEKIYHLPFDQQYDKVKIIKGTGETYCSTVKEAENLGFRRAFRYHIDNSF